MVVKLYISAGVPSNVIADMKLARRDIATGMKCIFPPARRTSFVLCLLLFLYPKNIPMSKETTNVPMKNT